MGESPIETVGNCQKSGMSQGWGIGGEAVSAEFPPEIAHLLDRDRALEKRPCVYARRGVPLEVDHVPFPTLVACPEEMVEPYLVERCC